MSTDKVNPEILDAAFADMINERGIYKKLGKSCGSIRTLRTRFKQGALISTHTKLELLIKSGWIIERHYTWEQAVTLIRFVILNIEQAKEKEREYMFNKWETQFKKLMYTEPKKEVFSKAILLQLISFTCRTSVIAREWGAPYILEKFLAVKSAKNNAVRDN